MNIYVGNIAHEATEEDVKQTFSAYGVVSKASIVKDKFTGNSRGFGFVEMASDEEAKKAIAELNGKELKGRPLTVNEARPREEGGRGGERKSFDGGSRGGFGGGSRGGFGGGDRGGRR
jgi:cold-inducible RNA-binding protein